MNDYHTHFFVVFADPFSDVILAEGISTFCDDLQVLLLIIREILYAQDFCKLSFADSQHSCSVSQV